MNIAWMVGGLASTGLSGFALRRLTVPPKCKAEPGVRARAEIKGVIVQARVRVVSWDRQCRVHELVEDTPGQAHVVNETALDLVLEPRLGDEVLICPTRRDQAFRWGVVIDDDLLAIQVLWPSSGYTGGIVRPDTRCVAYPLTTAAVVGVKLLDYIVSNSNNANGILQWLSFWTPDLFDKVSNSQTAADAASAKVVEALQFAGQVPGALAKKIQSTMRDAR